MSKRDARRGEAESVRSKTGAGKRMAQFALTVLALEIVITQAGLRGAQQSSQDLAQQIFDTMLRMPGTTAGYRVVHAKGIVCEGTFTASKEASAISRAAHFKGGTVPIDHSFLRRSAECDDRRCADRCTCFQ
jgi:catalase